MRVIDRARSWMGRKMLAGLDPLDDRYYQGASSMIYPTAAGRNVSETEAQSIAAVWACVDLISKALAILPVTVMAETANGPAPQKGHWLSRALKRRPNPYQTALTYKRSQMRRVLLNGNAYARIKPALGGYEFWPIAPERVTKTELLADGRVRYEVQRQGAGPEYLYRGLDMFHIHGPSMDGLTGLSVVAHARQTFGLALAMERHGAKLFGQGVRIAGVLTRPARADGKGLKEEVRQALETSFGREFGGEGGVQRVPILEDGMDWKPAGMSNEDAQFLESRRFSVGEIARWFGVPPHMVFDVERTTSWGTGIEAMTTQFGVYGLQPWCEEWEQALEMAFLDDEEAVKFDMRVLLRGDAAARAAFYQILRNTGAFTPNDILRLEDYPLRTDPGGDSYQDTPTGASPNGTVGADMAEGPTLESTGDSEGADEILTRANAVGVLVRAGYKPEDVTSVAGLPAMSHLGLPPVTIQGAGGQQKLPFGGEGDDAKEPEE